MKKDKIILHIDMNSYFASVEQQANPFLRGKPVGVCAYKSENGVIIASSIEAKKYGVKTATKVRVAKMLCPDIILVENEPAKYRSTTKKIFSILSDYTNSIEPFSIDEAFLDLTGYAKNIDEAKSIGVIMQKRIMHEVGIWLKSSVGVATTRWLAKFASDTADKGTINVITKHNLDNKLHEADLLDAWGINYRMAYRLQKLGIATLVDLKKHNPQNLMIALGKYGYFLWAHVNGIDIGVVSDKKDQKPKSIGHSYCLANKTKDKAYLNAVLMKLCVRTGLRLRDKNLEAGGISMYWTYRNGGGEHKTRKIYSYINETEKIFNEAKKLLYERPFFDDVRMLAVSVVRLRKKSMQQSLFIDRIGENALTEAVDTINNRYGMYTLVRGAMWGAEDAAHDRVGYRKTVEANWEEKNKVEYVDNF